MSAQLQPKIITAPDWHIESGSDVRLNIHSQRWGVLMSHADTRCNASLGWFTPKQAREIAAQLLAHADAAESQA